MTEKIEVHVPRRGIASELTEALGAHGLHAEIVDDGDICALRVRFADDEHERLVGETMNAIESWLSDRLLPLVVQRADGGCVVRPPGD
jgi:hypothetical protein